MENTLNRPPKIREKSQERSKRHGLQAVVLELIKARMWLVIIIMFFVGVALVFAPFLIQPLVGSNALLTQMLGLVGEIGKTLVLGGAATGIVRIFIMTYYDQFEGEIQRFVEQDVTNKLDDIRKDVQKQTQELVSASASLDAMLKTGVGQVYASRALASADIERDLTESQLSRIRLIGISLNDFVLGDQPSLGRAWKTVEEYVRGERALGDRKRDLDIKVLIVDPRCLGAELQSSGEGREPSAIAGRLVTAVQITAKRLFELENIAKRKSNQTGVSFQFRLYRLPAILFLCQTDTATYVQQYYFWASRSADVAIPVFRFRGSPLSGQSHNLHREMQDHFDHIWQNASISSSDFMEANNVGLEEGLYRSGAINVFSHPDEARSRMLWLLRNTKRRLYLQGISLKSFFDIGDLFAAIAQLVDRGDVEIKVLLLDPDSEQAYYRSFREYLFVNRDMTFDDYRSNPAYHCNSRLFKDTKETTNNIQAAILPKGNTKFQVKLYASAPACFLFMTDDSVIVEQYHYGKITPEGYQGNFPVILGKDMASIEYSRTPSDLFGTDPLRNPYKLLESHFDFVFDRCAH